MLVAPGGWGTGATAGFKVTSANAALPYMQPLFLGNWTQPIWASDSPTFKDLCRTHSGPLLYWHSAPIFANLLQDRLSAQFYTNCLDWTDIEGEKARVQSQVLQSSRESTVGM